MHPHVREATAEDGGESLLDFRFRGFRVLVEESLGRQNHAVQTKPALGGLLIDKSFLDWVRMFRRAKPFERHYFFARHRAHRRDAGSHRGPVYDRRARAALTQPAAELGTAQSQVVAQRVEQGSRGVQIQRVALAVDFESNCAHTDKVRVSGLLGQA